MDRIIKNIAEITDDNGDDIDSTPDNDNPDEDDIDDETIQLKYFDLSLLKYVTKVIVKGKVSCEVISLHEEASKSRNCGHYTTVHGIMQV